jgi:hypothetical protein
VSNATEAPKPVNWVEVETSHEHAQIPISVNASAGAARNGGAAGTPQHEADDVAAKVRWQRR